MKNGMLKEIDWKYLGALLANEGDDDQADFLKSFVKECKSWGTFHQAEMQLAGVNAKLTDDEKELLAMIGYQGE